MQKFLLIAKNIFLIEFKLSMKRGIKQRDKNSNVDRKEIDLF